MADKYVNATGVQIIKQWIEGKFATLTGLNTLSSRVDDIIAEGGEPNTIDSISVNGSTVTPDANKNVELTIPTKTSDLTNDGDGTSNFATEEYVDQNGGKIDVIKVNGTAQTITNKEVDLSIPTAVSDLTNDADYQNETEVQALIDAALADVTSIEFEVVQALPATGKKGVIYLLANSGSGQNIYDEYIWIDGDPTGRYEKIGTTEVDLSNYWTSETGKSNTLEAMTVAEINAILNA